MSMQNIVFELKNITKILDGKKVLDKISFKIYEKEFITILGEAGAGKTTLLKLIGLIINPNTGTFFYKGKDITQLSQKKRTPFQKDIGFMFQNFALFDFLNVEENIAFYDTFGNRRLLTKEKHQRVLSLLDDFKLKEICSLNMNELSGGMKRRIALARALYHFPKILLLDEPETGLDPINSDSILQFIEALQKEKTAVMITSNIHFAKKISHKILFLHKGKVEFFGDSDDFFQNTSKNPKIDLFIS